MSSLKVHVQTDPRYLPFIDHAAPREILGIQLPVARLEDVLQGKIWAALDPERPSIKRRKDLLDIERLAQAFPHLAEGIPTEIRDRLKQD
jgi:hypothetical protein